MRAAPLLALLTGLVSACETGPPRIPFQDTNWHASVAGEDWTINKGFVEDVNAIGIELVLDKPDTGGWAVEAAFRYAEGEDDGERSRLFDPDTPTGPYDEDDRTLTVDSEREIQFYELDLGVRQVYRPGARFQPYFGVGGAVLYWRSEEAFIQPALTTVAGFPNPFPVDTPLRDHERGEIYPGIYMRLGMVWNVLNDQLADDYEFPIGIDVRGLLSVDYSYLEVGLSVGYGK